MDATKSVKGSACGGLGEVDRAIGLISGITVARLAGVPNSTFEVCNAPTVARFSERNGLESIVGGILPALNGASRTDSSL